MKYTIFTLVFIALMISITGCSPGDKSLTRAEKIDVVADMESETLNRLYAERPSIRTKIKDSAGYGVFSNANVNIVFASAGGGYGVVRDNKTRKRTYMKMAMGGLGLGVGIKDYRVVLLFHDRDTMNKFINDGWEFGGHADAAAKAGDKGGELSGEGDFHEGIEVYSMTEAGLALQATVTGTKYWKDKELN